MCIYYLRNTQWKVWITLGKKTVTSKKDHAITSISQPCLTPELASEEGFFNCTPVVFFTEASVYDIDINNNYNIYIYIYIYIHPDLKKIKSAHSKLCFTIS